jgi:hypothetical protein
MVTPFRPGISHFIMISEEQQTIASLATSCYLDTIIVIVVATGYGMHDVTILKGFGSILIQLCFPGTFVLGTLIATRSLL